MYDFVFQDDNRYNSSRGAHLNLKRAEKVRVLVNKIPALVDMLVAKTRTWEEERGMSFTYDGVPLLATLDEYTMLRQEREEEKRRQRVLTLQLVQCSSRSANPNSWPVTSNEAYIYISLLCAFKQDQKRIHEQLATDQETLFGSRPSPARPLGPKKAVGPRPNGNTSNGNPSRRLSLSAHQGSTNGVRSMSRDGKRDSNRPAAPVNSVATPVNSVKEEAAPQMAAT
ncbi:hypothetical protein B296_00050285 [Ensete ventricosum]|uniref:Uncharacterized protein n=1 Tax=Ensete ventricosum TaxID=4639 RepID=A0A426XEM7_ENSVE|nr:hypothetical protein B296_00050285 [Ensete ventricosum]